MSDGMVYTGNDVVITLANDEVVRLHDAHLEWGSGCLKVMKLRRDGTNVFTALLLSPGQWRTAYEEEFQK